VRERGHQEIALNAVAELQRKKSNITAASQAVRRTAGEAVEKIIANRRTAGESVGAAAAAAAAASPKNKMERWKQKSSPVAAAAAMLQKGEGPDERASAGKKAFQRHLPAGRRPRTPDDDAGTNRSRGSKGSKHSTETGESIRYCRRSDDFISFLKVPKHEIFDLDVISSKKPP